MHDASTMLPNDGGNKNNWLRVETIGSGAKTKGIGVRVELGERILIDEVRSGGTYVSQSDFRLHFGLGSAEKADRLEIHWPSGKVDVFTDIPANQDFVAKEGTGEQSW